MDMWRKSKVPIGSMQDFKKFLNPSVKKQTDFEHRLNSIAITKNLLYHDCIRGVLKI